MRILQFHQELFNRTRREHARHRRPGHVAGCSSEPAVALGGVNDRNGQRAGAGHRHASRACQPRRKQIGFSDRNFGRMSCQPGQHDCGFRRPCALAAGEPGEAGVFQIAPQFVARRSTAKIVDQLRQFVHRAPIPLATTPRSTSFVPPRSVKRGECTRAVASSARSGSGSST